MRKAGSKPAYLLLFEPRDARSFTVVDGCLRTVDCFTNRPVTALRPRFPPDPLELLDLPGMTSPPSRRIDLACKDASPRIRFHTPSKPMKLFLIERVAWKRQVYARGFWGCR